MTVRGEHNQPEWLNYTTEHEIDFLQGLYHRGKYLTLEKYLEIVDQYKHWDMTPGVDPERVMAAGRELVRMAHAQFEEVNL